MTLTAGPTRSATGWTVDTSTFRARLALVRNKMEWNVKEAARECGLTGATWRLWELEGALPRDIVTVSKKIATRTGCDYLWLVHGPDQGGGQFDQLPHLREANDAFNTGGPTALYAQPDPQPHQPTALAGHLVARVGDPHHHPHPAARPGTTHAVRVRGRRLTSPTGV